LSVISDSMGNKGAFIRFEGSAMKPKFTSFTAVPHPSVQPMAYAGSLFRGGFWSTHTQTHEHKQTNKQTNKRRNGKNKIDNQMRKKQR